MTKQPSYRFVGHTEPWEEKKLGEVTSDLKSGLSRMLANEDIGLPVIRANNINDGYLDLSNDIKYWYEVDPQGSDTNNYVVKENDILINFINSEAKMGTSAIVRFPLDRKTIYTTNILRLRVSEGISSNFIFYIFSISRYINFIKSITKPAVNQSSFTTVDFKKFIIFLPSLPEQTAIGSFFQDIDQLINLQQRKLEVLKEQKKTYLKLLFPAKGQTKPALRFAGFEDEWKEVKLGEVVASERKGKAKSEMIGNKSIYLDTIYLNGGEQTRVDCDCDTSKEDIIILWDGSQAGAVYYGFEGALGSTLKSYKIFGSGSFYYQQMKASQSLIFERYRTPNIPHVIKSFLDDFYIFTTSLPEQEAIASFFQDLDKAIAKQEEKVNQLKESKQTLLRKMFI